jgi:hypothetical protein
VRRLIEQNIVEDSLAEISSVNFVNFYTITILYIYTQKCKKHLLPISHVSYDVGNMTENVTYTSEGSSRRDITSLLFVFSLNPNVWLSIPEIKAEYNKLKYLYISNENDDGSYDLPLE